MDWLTRTKMLINDDNILKLKNSTVVIFGVGGVGSFAAEAIARCGVGSIILVDNDVVDTTNINRQLIALNSTIGKSKVNVMKNRILDINQNANIITYEVFYPDNDSKEKIFSHKIDYIIDAIDSTKSKLDLLETALANNINIISCLGTGNKISPEKLTISDISKTHTCPLAKKIRVSLSKKGFKHLPVVFSTEKPLKTTLPDEYIGIKNPPGSISFVPPVAGFMAASYVIRDLINLK